ncbi:hypothetical protein [Catenuloplanes japonicus]|uniref:hypothetical protein n=1 Tax=Catenuloplanes japonicus TaxID=33876 RepID=UPI000527E987|nr:hypothetical protein [Catenuloplanes japonicus]
MRSDVKRLAPLVVLLALAGCTTAPDPQPEPADPPALEVPIAGADDTDVPDCDAEDRRRRELPDCGWYDRGVYREWTWVAAGRTTPPRGWSAAAEQRPAVTVAPARSAPTRVSGDDRREPAPTKGKPTKRGKR